MNLIERVKAPTPKIFRVLRAVGIGLAGIGGAILAIPAGLPLAVVTTGGYLVVAGSVASAVSQLTALEETENQESQIKN